MLRAAGRLRGVRAHVTRFQNANPVKVSKRSRANSAASAVLRALYDGREPAYFRMGGSIPAMALFHRELGVEVTMFAFGLADENVHAPDEFARVAELRKAERAYVMLLGELAGGGGAERGEGGGAEEGGGKTHDEL